VSHAEQFDAALGSPHHVAVQGREVNVDHLLKVVIDGALPVGPVRPTPQLSLNLRYLEGVQQQVNLVLVGGVVLN